MARIKGNANYTREGDYLGQIISHLNNIGIASSEICANTGVEKFDFYNIARGTNITKRRKLLELIIKEYSKDIPSEMQVLFSISVPVPASVPISTPAPVIANNNNIGDKYIAMLEKEIERLQQENARLIKQVIGEVGEIKQILVQRT